MFFRKKNTEQKVEGAGSPAPPWENIDAIPVRHSVIPRFDLIDFTMRVTGYGKWTVRLLLLGLAVSLIFISYLLYLRAQQVAPLPRDVNRPAMDLYASSTIKSVSTTTLP